MATRAPYDPYATDKEKRDLARARTAELQARTTRIEGGQASPNYPGYGNLATATAAETARERALTNTRLTGAEEDKNKLEALKAMHAAAVVTPNGEAHSKAALDEMAKMAGVAVPKTMDPQQEKANKIRAAKGLPPITGTEDNKQQTSDLATASTNEANRVQQENQSIFQPNNLVGTTETGPAPGTQPAPTGQPQPTEVAYGSPITPHLGTGGALITPENPTGNPANPWGAGGLFQNPTHFAAQNQQAIQAAMYPTGPVSPARPLTYFPGEVQDRLAGGRAIAPPTRTAGPPTDVYTERGLDLTPTGGFPRGLVTPPATPSRATGNMLPTPVAYQQPMGPTVTPPVTTMQPIGPTVNKPAWSAQPVNIDIDAALRAQAARMKQYTNY